MQTPDEISNAYTARRQIEATRTRAVFAFRALSIREKDYLRCLFVLAERPGFTGLSAPRATLLSEIAAKLRA